MTWQVRMAQMSLESEIWLFRTRVGIYGREGETKVYDTSADQKLAERISSIKSQALEGGDLKNTSFYSRDFEKRYLKHQQNSRSHKFRYLKAWGRYFGLEWLWNKSTKIIPAAEKSKVWRKLIDRDESKDEAWYKKKDWYEKLEKIDPNFYREREPEHGFLYWLQQPSHINELSDEAQLSEKNNDGKEICPEVVPSAGKGKKSLGIAATATSASPVTPGPFTNPSRLTYKCDESGDYLFKRSVVYLGPWNIDIQNRRMQKLKHSGTKKSLLR